VSKRKGRQENRDENREDGGRKERGEKSLNVGFGVFVLTLTTTHE
jgi:hypothetical protein